MLFAGEKKKAARYEEPHGVYLERAAATGYMPCGPDRLRDTSEKKNTTAAATPSPRRAAGETCVSRFFFPTAPIRVRSSAELFIASVDGHLNPA